MRTTLSAVLRPLRNTMHMLHSKEQEHNGMLRMAEWGSGEIDTLPGANQSGNTG